MTTESSIFPLIKAYHATPIKWEPLKIQKALSQGEGTEPLKLNSIGRIASPKVNHEPLFTQGIRRTYKNTLSQGRGLG